MADIHPALRRRPVPCHPIVFVDVYRRPDGHLIVHSCPDDRRALPPDCTHVGRAILEDERWSKRLGCALQRAKGAVVPREFAAQLIAEIQVIG